MMKYLLTSLLGTERDRAIKKRRNLEMSLHRLEEKAFLLEMELEETRRQREKVLKELRPVRHVSTVSVSSTDFSFTTDSSNIADSYCGISVCSSKTPENKKSTTVSGRKSSQREKPTFCNLAEEEEETSSLKWEGPIKYTETVEKY